MNLDVTSDRNPAQVDELDRILVPLYILERATRGPVVSVNLTRELIDRGVRCDSDTIAQIMRVQQHKGFLAVAKAPESGSADGAFQATDWGSVEAQRLLADLMAFCRTASTQ